MEMSSGGFEPKDDRRVIIGEGIHDEVVMPLGGPLLDKIRVALGWAGPQMPQRRSIATQSVVPVPASEAAARTHPVITQAQSDARLIIWQTAAIAAGVLAAILLATAIFLAAKGSI